jgi:hypothetical protein
MFRLFIWLCASQRFKTADRARSQGFLPRLELLDDRIVPSTTATVTSTADSGSGSLRDTIAAAHDGDTIVFANNLRGKTIELSSQLEFSTSLNILGPGSSKLTLSGKSATRLFHLTGGATTIAGLTIADGHSTGTIATGVGGGGAILNEAAATLTLQGDTFLDNHAEGAVGFTVLGGGLLNLGTATVLSCQFQGNQFTGGGAGDAIGGSAGGAIDNYGSPAGPAHLTITNSSFLSNTAKSAGGGYYYGIGGAIDDNAGLNGFDPAQAKGSTIILSNSTFQHNEATGDTGAIADAGAICLEGVGVSGTMVGCTISNNLAQGGDGGDGVTTGDSQGIGGGIVNTGTLEIIDCTITNNQAIAGKNASINSGDVFTGAAFGGGIENNSGSVLSISHSLISHNLAQGGATTAGPGGYAVGGGISNSPSATMYMNSCTVTKNSAIGGQGGPGTNASLGTIQVGFAFGGGIDISSHGSSATIINSQITGNQAIGGAGGSGNAGSLGYGGGIGVGWGAFLNLTDGSHLTLIDSVVTSNLAAGGVGGAGANGGDGLGGGLFVSSSGSATVIGSSLMHNTANGGHKGSGGANGMGSGGGVCFDTTGAFFADVLTIIKSNKASTKGNDVFHGT